jgi:hypothetical protein
VPRWTEIPFRFHNWKRGGIKAAKSRIIRKDGMLSNGQLATSRAQNLLAGCIFDRLAYQKRFYVTFGKVTKPCACRRSNISI